MVGEKRTKKYIPAIGIETHVQLKTKTKLFSGAGNDARDAKPNTLISHIDVAMPGALPVLNEKAVELAVKVAFILNTSPQKHSYFERKHYFYPDSPAGYQISQLAKPIIIGGSVDINLGEQKKIISVNRVQLEADAGKTTHPEGADYSLVDLNRAGTPLLEIVSEPELRSAAEAKAYVRELYLLMKYADISNVDLYHGNMRFDVNVSLSADNELGIRTEVKNLNSFKSVEAAVDYEIKRQTELLERGGSIIQETRGWDEAKQKTIAQRGKEEADDYRYFPEPDIPPLELGDDFIGRIKGSIPKLPQDYREEFKSLGLDSAAIEVLIDSPESAKFLGEFLSTYDKEHSRVLATWILHSYELLISGNMEDITSKPINRDDVYFLTSQVIENKISSNTGLSVWVQMIKVGVDPREYIEENGLIQISDEGTIEKIVKEVLGDNPKAAEDVKSGEMKAIGFLVGQVMARSKGQANPALAQQIIKKQLGV